MTEVWVYVSTPQVTGAIMLRGNVIVVTPPIWKRWIGSTWEGFAPRHYADKVERLA